MGRAGDVDSRIFRRAIPRPNSHPDRLNPPDSILEHHVNLESSNALTPEELQVITGFRRAAVVISLEDNVLLEYEVKPEDVKPKFLGRWGTCSGLVLTHAYPNIFIRKENGEVVFVVSQARHHLLTICAFSDH